MQLKETEEEKIARQKEIGRRLARSAGFQKLLNCSDGEKFLIELKQRAGVANEKGLRAPIFDKDPYILAYRAGMHDLIMFIENALGENLELYRKENNEKRNL